MIEEKLDAALGRQAAAEGVSKAALILLSFLDATSFAVMRSLRIREALAFDGDFTAAGFTALRS
jgi:predicted nucleic acid-binding protein